MISLTDENIYVLKLKRYEALVAIFDMNTSTRFLPDMGVPAL